MIKLDDYKPHWVINCGPSVHVVPDELILKWISGELPIDVEVCRRILEEWRDDFLSKG